MKPEVEFLLDVFEAVVDAQPEGHPLRRVDRNNALVYETAEPLDMTEAMHQRKADLEAANYVGVAWQSRDSDPLGQNYDLDGDIVCSVRLEGLTALGGEFGHIDPTAEDGVPWDDLVEDVRQAVLDERKRPEHPDFRDVKLDLRVVNEDDQSSQWRDFNRYEFDVIFNFRECPDQE